MQAKVFDLCIISEEKDIVRSVEKAISQRKNVKAKVVSKPIGQLNGKAISTMSNNDAIVFDIQDFDPDKLDDLKVALSSNTSQTPVIALTDGQISLSNVRQLKQVGIDHVLPLPVTEAEILGAIDEVGQSRISAELQKSQESSRGTVIGVGHAIGGAGATTLAVNLALSLLNRKGLLKKKPTARVALVDLDLQFGTVKLSLDIETTTSIMSVISSGNVPDDAFLLSIMAEHSSGISVLTAPEKPVPIDALRPDQIEAILNILRNEFDFIVLDLPIHIAGWMEPVISSLDKLYLLTDLSVPSVLQTKSMLNFYEDDLPDLNTTLVVNRDKKPVIGSRRLKEAQEVLGQKIELWLPDDNTNAREAMNIGIPIVEGSKNSKLSKNIKLIAKSIAKSKLSST